MENLKVVPSKIIALAGNDVHFYCNTKKDKQWLLNDKPTLPSNVEVYGKYKEDLIITYVHYIIAISNCNIHALQ